MTDRIIGHAGTIEGDDLIQQLGRNQISVNELQRALQLINQDRLKLSKKRAAITLEDWARRIRCCNILLLVSSTLIIISILALEFSNVDMSYVNSLQIENSGLSFRHKKVYYYTMRVIQIAKSCLIIALSISGIRAARRKIPPIILCHFKFTLVCVAIYCMLIVVEFVLMKVLYDAIVAEMAILHNVSRYA